MFNCEGPKEFIKGRSRKLASAHFWDITKRILVIPYRCLWTSYRSDLQRSRHPERKSI